MSASTRTALWILIVVAVAGAAGRILSAHLVVEPGILTRKWPAERPKPMPTFGSNDRSRWATIRALVDEGTYVVGKREGDVDSGIMLSEDGWKSIDLILHPETKEFYSSKPPFLSTLIAGLYWLLQQLTGWKLASQPGDPLLVAQPDAVVRTILLLVNALPFAIYLWVLARIALRYAATEWSRLVVVAAAAFGTMVSPFLITLNNHTFATFAVLWATAHALILWERRRAGQPLPWQHLVGAGLWAAFAVCNEMPALAFWTALLLVLLYMAPLRACLYYLPPGLVLAAAYFFTNYLAIGQLVPVQAQFGSPWYEYEGSHWRRPSAEDIAAGKIKTGIDWAHLRESRGEYAMHLLVGHHGFFSITPLWIIAFVGLLWLAKSLLKTTHPPSSDVNPAADAEDIQPLPWWLPLMTLGLVVVVVGFFLIKSDNYGGWTNGPRWLMWLAPLMLICLLPVLDRLACCKWTRGLTYAALGFSILAASYRPWNPWRHPWIYDALVWLGWPGY